MTSYVNMTKNNVIWFLNIDCSIVGTPEVLYYTITTDGEMSAFLHDNSTINCTNSTWSMDYLSPFTNIHDERVISEVEETTYTTYTNTSQELYYYNYTELTKKSSSALIVSVTIGIVSVFILIVFCISTIVVLVMVRRNNRTGKLSFELFF